MTLKELIKEFKAIVKVHPEANEAQVWAGEPDHCFHIDVIGFDKKHKPARILLESV